MATSKANTQTRDEFGPIRETTENEARAIYGKVMTCQPILGNDEVDGIERFMRPDSQFSVMRRVGLVLAKRDGSFFEEISKDRKRAVVLASTFEEVGAVVEALREIADAIEVGLTRARVALCNYEDIDAVLQEARAYKSSSEGPDPQGTAPTQWQ